MPFTAEQVAKLEAKLDGSNVRSRAQAGRTFSYLEGWRVIAEANRIFGFDAWDRETVELRQLGEPREVDAKWRVAYMARVRIKVYTADGEPTIREGCGYGSGIDRDLGSAHESALKEAETDAMKRGLMTFGNPFGLALYDKDQENVEHAKPATNGHATPRPPTPAPTRSEPVPALGSGATDTDLRVQAKRIETELKLADSLHKLDIVMDLNRAVLDKFSKVTVDYLQKYYERRREALELVA